jgi:hypothetical protein
MSFVLCVMMAKVQRTCLQVPAVCVYKYSVWLGVNVTFNVNLLGSGPLHTSPKHSSAALDGVGG